MLSGQITTTSTKRKKILVALFRFPFPAIDGTRYKILNNVIEGLSKEYDLEFLIATIEQGREDQIQYLQKKYGEVHYFRKSKLRFFISALSAFFTKKPLQVVGFFDRRVSQWTANSVNQYDAVYIHEIRMTEYFKKLPESIRKKCLVDFNDAISYNYEQASLTRAFPYNALYSFEANRVRNYESEILMSFFHFNIVSPHDRALLLRNAGLVGRELSFASIPHGVQVPSVCVSTVHSNKLFFLGQLDYAPNRDALQYFFDYLWKPLKERIPDVEFHIIGKGKQIAAGEAGIYYHGYVPDLFEAIQDKALLVAPIRIGAGVPSKIIEMMSYGIPTLTTPVAAAGLPDAIIGKHILVLPETDITEWIVTIERVLTDEPYRSYIGENSRSLIVERYSLEHSQAAFRDLFKTILN